MISTSEIKKNGWKHLERENFPGVKGCYTKKDPKGRGIAHLDHIDKETGLIRIWLERDDRIEDAAFMGYVPGRYQLQIIERCLGLG